MRNDVNVHEGYNAATVETIIDTSVKKSHRQHVLRLHQHVVNNVR